jgi:hypothetical protein
MLNTRPWREYLNYCNRGERFADPNPANPLARALAIAIAS